MMGEDCSPSKTPKNVKRVAGRAAKTPKNVKRVAGRAAQILGTADLGVTDNQPVIDTKVSSFSLMPHLHECSTPVDTSQNNTNQQIQHGQRSSNKSDVADRDISCFSVMPKPLHDCGNPTETTETAALPTSNLNSMAVEMESSGGVVEDYCMDDGELIEYPLRHSPQCVFLRPVPGVNIHPDYIWEGGKREPPVPK